MVRVRPWPSTRLSSLSSPAFEVPVLANNAAMEAINATSTRPITFIFPPALSAVFPRQVVQPGSAVTALWMLAPSAAGKVTNEKPHMVLLINTNDLFLHSMQQVKHGGD